MYYKWIEAPGGGVYLDALELAVSTNDMTPTIHTAQGTHYPKDWYRIEEQPEVDLWLFPEGPISAIAVKTVYRSAWNYDRWVKLFP